jgi:PAS domain S-box-containing protein
MTENSGNITEKKMAGEQYEKLAASELTLKLFVEYAPASIAMFDREMKYLAVSDRFIADYHLKEKDIVGQSHYDIFPEIGENWKEIHRKCLAGATEKAEKDPFLRADGTIDWIKWEIHPWFEKSGQIGGIILLSELITERIQAEEELVKSENRFRTTLETMLEGCQIMDFEWRYVFLNQTAEIHNRIPREKMLGKTYTEVWPGIEKTHVYSVIKCCLEQRTATHLENEFTYPDGSVGWFELSVQPVPEGVFILSIDITERKRTEEKLTEALENRSNIIRTSPHAIIVTDNSGMITVWNEAAEEMFGWEGDEVIGKPIPIIPEDKSEEVSMVRQRLLQGERIFNFETERLHKNGSLVQVSFSASPFRNGKCEITGILAEVQDISKRKQAEDQIKKLNEELELRVIERTKQYEAANKELEAFSYSVSHDLRAPLRAMSGFARILQDNYASSLDDEGIRVLQIITGNARKMGNLIDDLLAFSRLGKQETHFSIVNMHDLAESVYLELASEKEKNSITFILQNIPPAFGDASMIKQVWVNLIGNALKFSAFKDHRIIEIAGHEAGSEIFYSVKDNGAGFNMKYASKLFGVFQRLHSANQFDGTGVGLAIVQRIIKRHNGRVWAEGIEEEGATFYFTVPGQ